MPSYHEVDLTGAANGYQISDYRRVVFQPFQVLTFNDTVFINDKFRVIKTGTLNEDLVKGVDWDIAASDIDADATAYILTLAPDFTGVLVKSITMIREFTDNYSVQLIYNQLYPATISYSAIERENGVLEVTPELVGNMVEQLEHISEILANRTGQLTPQSDIIKLIREDLTGSNPLNRIIDEVHDVVSIEGVSLIAPCYGCFYENDVVVKKVTTGGVLVLGTDYKFTNIDVFKTQRSNSIYAVYAGIEVIVPMAGEVSISYNAFGDQIDILNLERIAHRLSSIERYINDNPYITPNSLSGSRCILSLSNKIATLEENMRALIKTGLPTYADVEENMVLVRKIISMDDNLHWWNIAKLYRVSGSTEDLAADTMRFRFQSTTTNMMFEVTVGVNLSTAYTGEKFIVSCSNISVPKNVLDDVCPKIRIVSTTDTGYPGVMLQIGMRLKPLYDTFAVENLSGRESCWTFASTSDNPSPAEDTDILLPDNNTIYVDGSPGALKIVKDLPIGGKISADDISIPLHINDKGDVTYASISPEITTNLTLDTVKSLSLSLIHDPGGLNSAVDLTLIKVKDEVTRSTFTGELTTYSDVNFPTSIIKITVLLTKTPVAGRCTILAVRVDDSINNVFLNVVGLSANY